MSSLRSRNAAERNVEVNPPVGPAWGQPLCPVTLSGSHRTLSHYLAAIKQRQTLVLSCLAIAVLLGYLSARLTAPTYQAWATLQIGTIDRDFLNGRDITPTRDASETPSDADIRSQIEILQEPSLLEGAVADLVSRNPSQPGLDNSVAIRRALASLRVIPVPQSRLIRLSIDSTSPALAATVATELADQLIRKNIEVRSNGIKRTKLWLDSQGEALQHQLEASEHELQAYARISGLLYTRDGESVDQDKLRAVDEQLTTAEADRISKESQFRIASQTGSEFLPQALGSSQLQDYEAKLTELRRQRAEMLSLLTPANYKVQRLDSQIAELTTAVETELNKIVARIRNEYLAALNRERMLRDLYATQSKLVSDDSVKAIHYLTLLQQVETTRKLHAETVQRAQEAGLASGITQSNIELISPATPPTRPYKPSLRLNVAFGVFVGLFTGVGLATVQEMRDRTFRSSGEPAELLRLPDLGVIPSANRAAYLEPRRRFISGSNNVDQIALCKPSLLSEFFRSTLTSIFFAPVVTNRVRVLAFTSPGPHEGKTTVVSNLGLALAEIGRKVLLINGDLRQPRLEKIFGVSSSPGFADILSNPERDVATFSLDDYIRQTNIPNLSILPSGSRLENVGSLLLTERLPMLFQRLVSDFDVILVDTPPCLQLADARLISRACDGVVLVVRAGYTSSSVAAGVVNRLTADQTRIIGTVLNDWNPRLTDSDTAQVYESTYRYYEQSKTANLHT